MKRIIVIAAFCMILLSSCTEEKPLDEMPPGYADWEAAKALEIMTGDLIPEGDIDSEPFTVDHDGDIQLPRVP